MMKGSALQWERARQADAQLLNFQEEMARQLE
jgi:hypothetical protein